MSKFYEFDQNNSGGIFVKPALTVIVEADNCDEANSIATNVGVYFDGVLDDMDCPCCGDRWIETSEHYAADVPSYYNKPIFTADGGRNPDSQISEFRQACIKADQVSAFLIVYKDGKQVRVSK